MIATNTFYRETKNPSQQVRLGCKSRQMVVAAQPTCIESRLAQAVSGSSGFGSGSFHSSHCFTTRAAIAWHDVSKTDMASDADPESSSEPAVFGASPRVEQPGVSAFPPGPRPGHQATGVSPESQRFLFETLQMQGGSWSNLGSRSVPSGLNEAEGTGRMPRSKTRRRSSGRRKRPDRDSACLQQAGAAGVA